MKLFAFLVALASVAVAGADASAFLATDKNFDSAVMNSGKHVFVKYLAPWCARDATNERRARDECMNRWIDCVTFVGTRDARDAATAPRVGFVSKSGVSW